MAAPVSEQLRTNENAVQDNMSFYSLFKKHPANGLITYAYVNYILLGLLKRGYLSHVKKLINLLVY